MPQNSLISKLNIAAQAQSLPNLMVDQKYGSAAQIMALPAAKCVGILQDSAASVYARAKACQRLAVVGDQSAVPALAKLLPDPQLSVYARFALEPMPGAAVDEALRNALATLKGHLLVGVVSSLGHRKDIKAIAPLEKLRHDPDKALAKAADAALARIRPPL